MKRRAFWGVLAAVVLILLALELSMERRYSLYTMEQVYMSQTEILSEMPEIAVSEEDRALAAHVLSSPQVQDLLERAANSHSLAEVLPVSDTEALLEDWITPECYNVELSVMPPFVYVTLNRDSPDSSCTYTLDPEQESHITKTIGVYEGTGSNRICAAVYENDDGQLSKSARKRVWFAWIQDFMEDKT